jgi:hypothetical protein
MIPERVEVSAEPSSLPTEAHPNVDKVSRDAGGLDLHILGLKQANKKAACLLPYGCTGWNAIAGRPRSSRCKSRAAAIQVRDTQA